MKLRNKETGEIIDIKDALRDSDDYPNHYLISNDWEDYEEPQEYWYVDGYGEVQAMFGEPKSHIACRKNIGNYFETKEEAEKAVDKLKAITRLSKCGFRFEGYTDRDRANGGDIVIFAHVDIPNNNLLEEAQPDMLKDLDLLFSVGDTNVTKIGGEE